MANKISMIAKLAQSAKTAICNSEILENIVAGKISICFSKNTLSAKDQWFGRLCAALTEKGHKEDKIKKLILTISSKYDGDSDYSTHCKNMQDATHHLMDGNFMVIFVCSHSTRIKDMTEFVDRYDKIYMGKIKPISYIP